MKVMLCSKLTESFYNFTNANNRKGFNLSLSIFRSQSVTFNKIIMMPMEWN